MSHPTITSQFQAKSAMLWITTSHQIGRTCSMTSLSFNRGLLPPLGRKRAPLSISSSIRKEETWPLGWNTEIQGMLQVGPCDGYRYGVSPRGQVQIRLRFWSVLPCTPEHSVSPLIHQSSSNHWESRSQCVYSHCGSCHRHYFLHCTLHCRYSHQW